jgi:GGDEF domain-containing protein
MTYAESLIWAVMVGGVLAFVLLAAAHAVVLRSLGALRNLLLIGFMGAVCVALTGLPGAFFPAIPQRLILLVEASLGPLGGAMGVRFMGIWLGGAREDRVLHLATFGGCYLLMIGGLVLAVLAMIVPAVDFPVLLWASLVLVNTANLITLLVGLRAMLMGDPLARWLPPVAFLLTATCTGLYLNALNLPLGLFWKGFAAACALVSLLIVMVLVIVRNRANDRLARLARLDTGREPVTGLHTGARLLADVEHAFWRAGRMRGHCAVVCVYLNNLYELSDVLGHTTDNQILAATAARIRRVAGFRCVLGVYHPRCFVIVFTMNRQLNLADSALVRMRNLLTQPLQLVGTREQRQSFQPVVGIAVEHVQPDRAVPLDVINELERRAMDEVRQQTQAGTDNLSPEDAAEAPDTVR